MRGWGGWVDDRVSSKHLSGLRFSLDCSTKPLPLSRFTAAFTTQRNTTRRNTALPYPALFPTPRSLAMTSTLSVAASYRQVRRLSRRSGSNFYRSFWLLPRCKRDAMCALYAFARVTDDLGDCHEPASLRRKWLNWWRQTTALNVIGQPPAARIVFADGPASDTKSWPIDLQQRAADIFPALRDAVTHYQIPTRYLLEIVDGVIADQQKTRFDTFEQLEHYCYLVASAVGLACLHIWQFNQPLPTQAAEDCGLAFQLTNILRDVAEDAQRGRIYLPRQHYEQHGLCEDDLLSPRPDDRFKCLMLDEVLRAKRLFESGWQVWDSLHSDGRPIFSMMWRTYRQLLDAIENDPGAVTSRRLRLSTRQRIELVSQHFWAPRFRRLPVPPWRDEAPTKAADS